MCKYKKKLQVSSLEHCTQKTRELHKFDMFTVNSDCVFSLIYSTLQVEMNNRNFINYTVQDLVKKYKNGAININRKRISQEEVELKKDEKCLTI